jgi:multisubunit Na+/H+ antiporter MnhB subunit
MRLRHVHLVLCLAGFVLPYSQLIPWVMKHGLNLALLFRELFANQIGAFFGLDVIVSAIVLLVLVFGEGRRLRMRHLWLPVVATLTVGVSLGLPLFLYLRQRHLDAVALS